MVIAYKEFNKDVTEEERTFDASLLERIKPQDLNYDNHKHIYEKLIRNLSSLLNGKYKQMGIHIYCRFLYQWLLHSQKKCNINEFALSLFYEVSHDNVFRKGAISSCPYYSYDTTYKEPLNIIKLDNFHENIQEIKSTLDIENYQVNSPCQKYVCECVKIYKTMHYKYCPYEGTIDTKLKNTCDILNKFKSSYMAYLFGQDGIKDKLPPLNGSDIDDFPRCLSDKSKPELGSELGSAQSRVRGAGLGLEQHSQATSPASEQ
ncbi:hypothetical protein PVNG_02135 [Plasmodium vivax North Korean]|uniref:Variable surface protein n=1 Tax=Plasmodium vivax North Korean TaxID=1035514 RepID=A0A0J9TWN0_PLAVI|nr:hypothetical protein PVNG_02135 [Plasmodium vivax North Korean]